MSKKTNQAPKAKKKPHIFSQFNQQRIDNYYWLKDKTDPQVISYLQAENAYTDEIMADTQSLQDTLYHEILGRIKEDDESYPTFIDGYWYYSRSIKNKDYAVYLRKKTSLTAAEEIIFDLNSMAEGHQSFIFDDYEISPDNRLAAYLYNTSGSYAEFTLKIKDLVTGKDLDFCHAGVSSIAWANDSQTLFFTTIDSSLRSNKVFKQSLGQPTANLVYEELDKTFNVAVSKSKNKRLIMIFCSSHTSSETLYLPCAQPNTPPQVFLPRQKNVEYAVYTHPKYFYIYYKDKQNPNAKLYRTTFPQPANFADWQLIIQHSAEVMLDNLDILNNHLLIQRKSQALNHLSVLDLDGKLLTQLQFPEQVYLASLIGNPEQNSHSFRYSYSALNRPTTLYEVDLISQQTTKLKQTEIPAGFTPDDYQVERLWATSADGVKVPMAIIYKKSLPKTVTKPTLIYAYGSYGSNTEANFRSSYFSLIDRGFIFAIAQVRGGSEMGEQWYQEGKFLAKKNTFNDFISAAEMLIANGYSSANKLAIAGGSAGGLLIGAVVNMRPELFNCAVAYVPFVDVVTTMLDESLPLTIGEYEEWGNPNDEEFYRYMLSYSPYDNIVAQDYPHILATGGINDSQVLFHEPAKWIAKLRASKTNNNFTLLKMNMDSGHGGATGKYASIKELAFELAFILKCTL